MHESGLDVSKPVRVDPVTWRKAHWERLLKQLRFGISEKMYGSEGSRNSASRFIHDMCVWLTSLLCSNHASCTLHQPKLGEWAAASRKACHQRQSSSKHLAGKRQEGNLGLICNQGLIIKDIGFFCCPNLKSSWNYCSTWLDVSMPSGRSNTSWLAGKQNDSRQPLYS